MTAVYRFETKIDSANADLEGGRLSYVGLSGGFGTVTVGRMPNAAHVHAGFVDNSQHYGTSELANKVGDTISYSVDVGAASFQVDAIADSGMKGKDADSAQFGATVRIGDNAKVGFGYISHATMDMDTPVYAKKAAISGSADTTAGSEEARPVTGTYTAKVDADPEAHLDKDNQAQIAGQYSIGGVTLHLGYGERKKSTDSKAGVWDKDTVGTAYDNDADPAFGKGLVADDKLDAKDKTTFFGFAGGLGDTGFAYNFQMRSKKDSKTVVTHSYEEKYRAWQAAKNAADNDDSATKAVEDANNAKVESTRAALGGTGEPRAPGTTTGDTLNDAKTLEADRARGTAKETSKSNPWVFGLSRSLGGGASVILEHENVDSDSEKNTTGLFLVVNF